MQVTCRSAGHVNDHKHNEWRQCYYVACCLLLYAPATRLMPGVAAWTYWLAATGSAPSPFMLPPKHLHLCQHAWSCGLHFVAHLLLHSALALFNMLTLSKCATWKLRSTLTAASMSQSVLASASARTMSPICGISWRNLSMATASFCCCMRSRCCCTCRWKAALAISMLLCCCVLPLAHVNRQGCRCCAHQGFTPIVCISWLPSCVHLYRSSHDYLCSTNRCSSITVSATDSEFLSLCSSEFLSLCSRSQITATGRQWDRSHASTAVALRRWRRITL